MAAAPDAPTLHSIDRFADSFRLVGSDGAVFTVKWLWTPSRPTRNDNGVTGWADHNGNLIRVHVCAHNPCNAVYPPSKYGNLPAPKHGRLLLEPPPSAPPPETEPLASQPPAIAEPAPEAPELLLLPPEAAPEAALPAVAEPPPEPAPGFIALPAVAELPPVALEPSPSPLTPAPPALPAASSSSSSSSGCPPEPSAASVAPPPIECPPLPPDESISPPRRAALARGVAAPPLENVARELAPVPAKALQLSDPSSETHTMVMVDDPDDAVVVGETNDADLAKQVAAFIEGLQGRYAYIGVSAFLLLALLRRLRLFVWYGLQRVDIVQEYAPWASEAITDQTQFEAIGCVVGVDAATGETFLRVPEDARDVNHWVAGVRVAGGHGDGAEGALALLDSSSDETRTFAAIYFSVSLIVLETIADGTCGLDVMCLMLGLKREKVVRQALRWELGAFVLRHVGNRALIQSLFTLGEVTRHLGFFELGAAGAVVLADASHDTGHGDGSGGDSGGDSHGDSQVALRSYTDEERLAVKWKCGLHAASREAVLNIIRALPEWCVEQAVSDYKASGPIQNPAPRKHFILTRDTLVGHKQQAAKAFVEYCEGREAGLSPVDLKLLEAGRMPYGLFAAFVKENAQLARVCKKNKARYGAILAMYKAAIKAHLADRSAVAVDGPADKAGPADEAAPHARFRYHTPRQGQQYYSTQYAFQRPWARRRGSGGGRKRAAAVLRELLMEWYSSIRHSVDVKIMVRFPKQVLLVKAQMLQQEYCALCLRQSIQVEPVDITMNWVNGVLHEYRLTHRVPNRKYKVARWVLAERLEIFWLSVMKLRKFILLHFGYDPACSNVDQSPFHKNEAGSKECQTLALKGAPIVPLIENHAATRERWSLNSITKSDEEAVRRRLPGFETMWRADGKQVELRLQEYVFAKGLPFTVTVVTGSSGSYKEEDIIVFLEKHLLPWGPGRRWELFLLDAYAPGLTDNVQRLCWSKGYVEITHGGGASLVAQTNDTDHHLWVRKRFIEIQTDRLIRKARGRGGGLVDLTREENIDIMIEVMSDLDLHLKACKGYKYTGTTVAFDGTEDSMICREAKEFWEEREMRQKIDAAVADVECKYRAGALPWTWENVKSLIGQYPRRGQLDVLKPGQDDEATPDPDGVPWEREHAEGAGDSGSEPEDDCGPQGDDGDEDGDGEQGEFGHRGHGESQEAKGEASAAKVEVSRVALCAEQADTVIMHSGRLQALQQAKEIFKGLGGTVAASLTNTVNQVMHTEAKRFRERTRGDAAVAAEMRATLEKEEAHQKQKRAEFQESMQQQREKKRAERELKETQAQLKKARREIREASAVVTASQAIKSYSLSALGQGKKKGGGMQFQKTRSEALERVRSVAQLSPQQRNDWENFKAEWDKAMAEIHGEGWAELFAQILQNVIDELENGTTTALSDFMYRETKRVLGHVPALVVPGFS